MKNVGDYMHEGLVLFLNETSRDEVIEAMVNQIDAKLHLPNKEHFHQAILEREKIVSTGIGMGVAVPHAKMADYNDFFIDVAILQKGVNWSSFDHTPVRLVFMIGGPDDKQTEYLQLLSSLTLIIKNDDVRKKLLKLNSASEIVQLFKTI